MCTQCKTETLEYFKNFNLNHQAEFNYYQSILTYMITIDQIRNYKIISQLL